MSTPTRLLLPHVHFSVIVFGTKPSETSISRYVSAPRLFSDMCTSYCACVNSTIGILVFSPDNMSRMISYDVRAFDGFSLKAGPKCTNVSKFVHFKWKGIGVDEFSVWDSRKRCMEKKQFWCFCQQKRSLFKVHSFVWRQPEMQIKQRELSLLLYSHFISVTLYTTCLTLFKRSKSDGHQFSPNDIHTLSRD